jgi:hypothetical protein
LWRNSFVAAALLGAAPLAAQSTAFRISYGVRLVQRARGEPHVLSSGVVSGPQDTDLRLILRTDTVEVDALLDVFGEPDSVNLSAAFSTRRRAGRSTRGLYLWEADTYRRAVRFPWGGTTRLYPFGSPQDRGRKTWLEITVSRGWVGGETRPEETVAISDSSIRLEMEAVLRPRRAAVRVALVRGDNVSAPRVLDLVPNTPGRRVTFVLGRRDSRTLDFALTHPAPSGTVRDSAVARDADVLCLRVTEPATPDTTVRCGHLNNVARRFPLGRDTLVATFAWPASR